MCRMHKSGAYGCECSYCVLLKKYIAKRVYFVKKKRAVYQLDEMGLASTRHILGVYALKTEIKELKKKKDKLLSSSTIG